MKINWKLRFKSPVFVVTFLTTVLSFIYNLLGMLDLVPRISEQQIGNLIIAVVQILSALGILNDPTSCGLRDCDSTLSLEEPRKR